MAFRHIILMAISLKFPKKYSHSNRRKLLSSTTPLSSEAPAKRNPLRICSYTSYFQKLDLFAYIFVAACMGLSLFKFVQWAAKDACFLQQSACVLAVQGRSGSSKVSTFGTNRKRIYDFLLVRHCDYVPLLHRSEIRRLIG